MNIESSSKWIRYEPLNHIQNPHYTALISFNRIIREEQMDDIIEMMEYMMITLDKLESLINEQKMNKK